jgi:hypothetical protein
MKMKVHDLIDKEGRIFAFEVSNMFFSRRRLCKLVGSIPGVLILKVPGPRSYFKGEEEFCEFEICGQKFVAWEPFGDNSRYWIGLKPPHWCEQVEIIRSAFMGHKLFKLFDVK